MFFLFFIFVSFFWCFCFAFFCFFSAFFCILICFFFGLLFCFAFFHIFFTNKLIFKFIGFWLSGEHNCNLRASSYASNCGRNSRPQTRTSFKRLGPKGSTNPLVTGERLPSNARPLGLDLDASRFPK